MKVYSPDRRALAFNHILTLNGALINRTSEYEAATVTYSTIISDGYGEYSRPLLSPKLTLVKELDVKEIRPPRMDDSGRVKYPVLFRV
jgi:dipeptidyl aminopeptidase